MLSEKTSAGAPIRRLTPEAEFLGGNFRRIPNYEIQSGVVKKNSLIKFFNFSIHFFGGIRDEISLQPLNNFMQNFLEVHLKKMLGKKAWKNYWQT